MNDNSNASAHQANIETSLFLLRLTVFLVMFVWTLDKFIDPGHGANILKGFYFISGAGETVIMIMGAVEMVLILAFLAGMWKKYTYGIVLLLHGLTTFSSWQQYLNMNLLFYAAWPMMAACVALYLLRDLDVKYTVFNQ
ncbi:MAG: hypothetical protein HOJ34_14590 [Kordiimonadaceae bacterium]|jgi:putative oxidoreductase|nr:hypothetical protein [Kordiimonadaceae bacterium]MBT6036502.1 hypothetical protein [Kordiimonadaceae bacterium]MBT6331003.1 hypothetical protein [Kordiimonadaceae bacterium]